MKKRVFSLILALIFSIGLLPAAAFAEGEESVESGAAQVMTAEGTEQVYDSFTEAWSAAIESAGSTLKLLSDVTLPEGENGLSVSEGKFTLDLNNKTLKGAIWEQLLTVSDTANITIKNGSLVNTKPGPAGAVGTANLVALAISGGTVALDNVNLTSGINSENKYAPALYITGGSLTVNGSTFTGEVMVICENSDTRPALSIADATLNNGIAYGVVGAQASDVAGLKAIFADGSMLFDKDKKYIDLASKEYWLTEGEKGAFFAYTNECAVKPHTHKVVNGACECGATFAASVTQNGTVTYYKDFNTALNAANAGDTLTLLTDVQGGNRVTIDKEITFDLNGHEIYYDVTVKCKITLKDSAGGTGKIAEWLRVEHGLNIGDLLEEGYALRNAETGAWYGATEQTVGNVTVQQAPITSVTLTALNADNAETSKTMPYGTTNGIKLSASCTTQGAGELSCQWYTIGGTASQIEDAKGTEYNLPADLPVGEHKYLVTCTADGYSKSAEITITVTVTPRDLKNATVEYYTTDNPTVVTYNPLNDHICGLLIHEVTLGGVELKEGTDYIISGNTAAEVGKHTAILTAKSDSTKCKGTLKIDWEVVPYALPAPSFEGNQKYTKIYDGTTTLPEGYKFQALFLAKESGSSEVDWRKDENNYEVTAAEFVSADAGENKPINQTITLKNENFVFEPTEIINVNGITTTDRTITYKNFTLSEAYPTLGTYFNIEKATMPDVDNAATLTVINDLADTYTVDLAALLPKLESPKTYGEIGYSRPAVWMMDSGYYTGGAGNAKVENGKLILNINKNPVTTTGSIGTVTVNVSSTNYRDFSLTVNVNAANKSVSYSGDSNPTVKSETTTNPDGSVTKTEIKADGTVIGTTTKPDGSVIKTETKPDGSSVTETRTPDGSTGTVKTDVNGRTEASVNVSRSAVEEAKATGNAVQIPAVVAASRDSSTAPTVEIHLPTNAGETKVEIPVSNVNSGTVAVLVHPDGTEEIVKSSIPTETGIQLTVTGSTTLKIIDNTKPFQDINGHWAENSIGFVGARELFMGTGANTFSPDIDMSRAQLWTVLARQENADLSGGSNWYEKSQLWAVDKGISDGTNPQDPISRAQMISMLWRTAGSPGTTDSPWFTDVPADAYYTDAVAWAVKNNITSGVGNGKFDPNAVCTRAQVATFLRNAYENDIF